jgi:TonB family protein
MPLANALAHWTSGDAAQVARAHAEADAELGPTWTNDRRMVWRGWIVALAFSDPAAAQAKLDAWMTADTTAPDWTWRAQQWPLLQAQIHLAASAIDKARAQHRQLKDDRLKANAAIASNKNQLGPVVRLGEAEALLAFALDPEAGLPPGDSNPFLRPGEIFLPRGFIPPNCDTIGMDPKDWVMLAVRLNHSRRQMLIEPLAESRPALHKPFIVALAENGYEARTVPLSLEPHVLLVRCTRKAELQTGRTRYREAMLNYARAVSPEWQKSMPSLADTATLARLSDEGNLLALINLSEFIMQDGRGRTRQDLAQMQARDAAIALMTKQGDAARSALTTYRFEQLRLGQGIVGDAGGKIDLKARALMQIPPLATYIASVRADTRHDPAQLAWLMNELARLHRQADEAGRARSLYEQIIAMAPLRLSSEAPEVITAHLGLADIAQSAQDSAKANAIIAALGLNPDQCSLYQDKPSLTQFSTPHFPPEAMRRESQGLVTFEFDLDNRGKARNFRILAATPPFMFERLTVDSFTKAQFLPVTRGGGTTGCDAAVTSFVWKLAN